MASFTDAISQFNPYVQQLPVDAMLKVGTYKQGQYDQGVQKIQSYVDNVAGMSVLRPVDKEHLQSKINQLGSKLKTVAAGDFSNSQLVNSVGGMVGQVVKDPIVMAAVYSTQNDSKNQAEMDADEKSGKLTPHARYFYERKRNEYLNNTELKSADGRPVTFSGKYQRSWDLDKNIIDAVDAVGDRKNSAKQIFKTDPVTGQLLYNTQSIKNPKTGKIEQVQGTPILSEYATVQIKEGKFSENISAAIDSVLSRPEAQQELMMRGIYTYRGYDDVNDFVGEYENEKEKGLSLLESKKLELMNKSVIETDPDRKEQIQQLLNNTENDISNLKNYEDPRIKQALETKDLDAYKSMVYAQRQKNNWMTSYVTESNTIDYVESAPWKAHMDKIKSERDWWKDQQGVSQGWSNIQLRGQEIAISASNAELAKEKWKYDPTNPDAPTNQANPYEKAATPQDLYSSWLTAGTDASDNLTSSKQQFVIDYMKALNYGNGKTTSDDEVARAAYQYEKARPGFFDRQFELAKDAVTKNPKNPAFVNLLTSLPTVNGLEKKVENFSREVDELNNDPEVLKASGGVKLSDVKFKTVNIKGVTVTPKDQINLARWVKAEEGSPERIKLDQQIKASTGLDYRQLMSLVVSSGTGGPFSASDKGNETLTNILAYGKLLGSDVTAAKEKVIQGKLAGNSPLAFELFPPGAKEPEKATIVDKLKTVLADKGIADEDVSKFSGFYSGTGAEKEGYSVNIGVNRGGATGGANTFTLDLYNKSGLEKSVIISKADADYIKGTVLKVPSPKSDVVQRVAWNTKTNSTNSLTTDPNNPNAYKGAYYKSDAFYYLNRPNLLGADVKVNSLGQPNVFFYVKDANGNSKAIPFKTSPSEILPSAFASIDHAEKFIQGISSPAQIDNILKNSNTK